MKNSFDNSVVQDPQITAWSPLRQPVFRALWIATVVSNIGTWMHDVGAGWLMTSLAPSPLMVALVQVATNLPVFLLALPAGALADVVDRRRLLLVTQGWMLAAAIVLGSLTIAGATTPWVLLSLTFVLALGTAMNAPAWQAITPELVSRQELPAAVTLSGIGINVARAVGPALGGLIIAATGPGVVFLLNGVSFLGIITVLYHWRRPPRESVLPAERFIGAMRAGMRYVRHAPALQAVLIRAGAFILFGSALWALLPSLARFELGQGPGGYGILLGLVGLGAIGGATILPRLRQKVAVDKLVIVTTILFAGILSTLAFVRDFVILGVTMFVAGAAWMALLSSFNTAAQTVLPAWVRARALSVYLLIFFGGLAGGSALWGIVATHAGISRAFIFAALGVIASLLTTVRYRLVAGKMLDLTPSLHWPAPAVVNAIEPEHGPVLVMIEYRIDPAQARDFADAMRDMRKLRLRDGAINWGIFADAADPSRYVETFIAESWVEHLRQHERVIVADREIEARVRAFHQGAAPPVVSHFVHV
ncbi:MAG: MFS transporter [bacterium]